MRPGCPDTLTRISRNRFAPGNWLPKSSFYGKNAIGNGDRIPGKRRTDLAPPESASNTTNSKS